MAGMRIQSTSGVMAESFQPASALALLCGVAEGWSAFGVRFARVVGMNRSAGMRIVRGGGSLT